jgi:pimeloyl-ACP methyl ester carboxylesterase
MSAVTIDDHVLHYEAIGRGKPVLFLHGWLGSWRYWMSSMEAIADKHRTYALDLWGFGDSHHVEERYTIHDYVTLVDTFIKHMGIQEITIVGHALGAVVMLEYAVRRPKRAHKLMAVSLPLSSRYLNHRLLNTAENALLSKLLWQWQHQVLPAEIQTEARKTDQQAIKLSLKSVGQLDPLAYVEHLGRANDPLLLAIHGERDNIVAPGPILELDGLWPTVRAIGLADSKHFPMLDEPVKFQRLLKDFLDAEADLSELAPKEIWYRRLR